MEEKDYRALRREYLSKGLKRKDLDADPVIQFTHWMDRIAQTEIDDATAMTLATADQQCRPSARIVLLKHFDDKGFCWYTDHRSDKGQQLAQNPWAELLFFWPQLSRQVRIRGRVETLDDADNDRYFHERPVDSRFSAASSLQSATIASRAVLEQRIAQLKAQYPEGDVPRPKEWGGYRLRPDYFEFWQGRASRLHDRFIYRLQDQQWHIERLSP